MQLPIRTLTIAQNIFHSDSSTKDGENLDMLKTENLYYNFKENVKKKKVNKKPKVSCKETKNKKQKKILNFIKKLRNKKIN